MSECRCSDDNKIIGTYCRYCEPQEEIDLLKKENTELVKRWTALKAWIIEADGYGEWFVLEEMKRLES